MDDELNIRKPNGSPSNDVLIATKVYTNCVLKMSGPEQDLVVERASYLVDHGMDDNVAVVAAYLATAEAKGSV